MTPWRAIGLVALLAGRAPVGLAQQPAPLAWQPVAIATTALAAGFLLDGTIARDVRPHRDDLAGASRTLSRFGEVTVSGPVLGGLALVGVLAHRPILSRTALQGVVALLAAGAGVAISKEAAGRHRPYEVDPIDPWRFEPFSGHNAFPSGHSASAFALATVLGDAADRTWARIGLYALATGTAAGRVIGEKHWTSDVVAGAAIGVLAGKLANGRISVLGLRAPAVLVGPTRVGFRVAF